MTLPTPVLDDRTFQDLVDEAKQLIPKHCPEWTNHNLADPGIALLELFAFMTEMTIYRLNQVPDRLYVKFLELVGIDLFPARAAGTDLTFWLSTGSAPEEVSVPGGTEVATRVAPGASGVVFTTDRDLHMVQPQLAAVLTQDHAGEYVDYSAGIRRRAHFTNRNGILCFGERPRRGDSFCLGLALPGPASGGSPRRRSFAGNLLRLHLTVTTIEGIGVDPDRAPVRWEAWSPREKDWMPARKHTDDTGGLNRSGAITLVLPPDHGPRTLGPVRKSLYWVRARLDDPEEGEWPYVRSPKLHGIRPETVGGTVSAHHCQRAPAETVGRSDGRPGQVFKFGRGPLLPCQGDTVDVTNGEGTTPWKVVKDFGASRQSDHHVVWDASAGELRFGPAIRDAAGTVHQHGSVPPRGSEVRVSGYRFGGGAAGNVGAGTLTVLRTTIPMIDSLENPAAAEGGVDPESLENAKLRAPGTLRTGRAAVTAEDYERLTGEIAGVARAWCFQPVARPLPAGTVQVLVVPQVDRGPRQLELDDLALSDRLGRSIERTLEKHRTLGTSVVVGAPSYQGISVATKVRVTRSGDGRRGAGRADVQSRALQALYRYFDPRAGGPYGTGWPFGQDAEAEPLCMLLESLDGIAEVEDLVLFEADLRQQRRLPDGAQSVELAEGGLFLSFRHRVVVTT